MSETKFGLLTPEQINGLSWRQIFEQMISGELPQPPFCQTLNATLMETGEGFAAQEGEPGPQHQNPDGSIQGGWVLTLIDSVSFCAATTALKPGVGAVTVETKANFCRAIMLSTGRIRGEGRIISRGRRIITCDARITDAAARVLAHGTSTIMVLS